MNQWALVYLTEFATRQQNSLRYSNVLTLSSLVKRQYLICTIHRERSHHSINRMLRGISRNAIYRGSQYATESNPKPYNPRESSWYSRLMDVGTSPDETLATNRPLNPNASAR